MPTQAFLQRPDGFYKDASCCGLKEHAVQLKESKTMEKSVFACQRACFMQRPAAEPTNYEIQYNTVHFALDIT